jgi:hypothetical protein
VDRRLVSGGRENGVQAIDNYTQTKNVCANIDLC